MCRVFQSERATFQLALISNGRLSFGIITWQWNQMKWNYMKSEPLIIGFSNGQEDQAILSEYSDTSIGFKKMDKIIGNTGNIKNMHQASGIGLAQNSCSYQTPISQRI